MSFLPLGSWTNRDRDFADYARMMQGSGYSTKTYTYDKFRTRKRTPIPRDKRQAVYLRSWGLCEKCQNSELDHINHIDRNPSNHNLDNLIGLCLQCHKRFHKRKPNSMYGISYGGITT